MRLEKQQIRIFAEHSPLNVSCFTAPTISNSYASIAELLHLVIAYRQTSVISKEIEDNGSEIRKVAHNNVTLSMVR